MRVPHYGPNGKLPSPRLVAAWLKIDALASEWVPLWTAHWLADGLDGEALRMLAGMDGSDSREVRDILPAALNDGETSVPDDLHTAVNTVYGDLAARYLAGEMDTERLIAQVEHLMATTSWDDATFEPPLGSLYGLQDEWEGNWGRPRAELTALTRQTCQQQVAHSPQRPTSLTAPR